MRGLFSSNIKEGEGFIHPGLEWSDILPNLQGRFQCSKLSNIFVNSSHVLFHIFAK